MRRAETSPVCALLARTTPNAMMSYLDIIWFKYILSEAGIYNSYTYVFPLTSSLPAMSGTSVVTSKITICNTNSECVTGMYFPPSRYNQHYFPVYNTQSGLMHHMHYRTHHCIRRTETHVIT
jgi:hypothetical protein